MSRFHILIILIIAQLASSCIKNKSTVRNEWNEWKLKGAVKSLSETDYSKNGKYRAWLLFNSDGFIQEQTTFNPDGSLIRKWKYTYNSQNQKLTRYCYVLKDSLSQILHYTYNQSNKITDEKLLSPVGALISDIEHLYDKNLNEIEKRFTDAQGKRVAMVKNKFDIENNIIEEVQFDSIAHQNGKNRFFYNDQGLKVEIVSLSLQDSLIKKSIYSYCPDRQVSETNSYNAQNKLISKTIYKYDKHGNMTLKQTFNILGETTEKLTFNYKYDNTDNWTYRYEYLNDQVEDIISRKLEYYK